MDNSTITCHEIIDADVDVEKLNGEVKSNNEEAKTKFNGKTQPLKRNISIFFFFFFFASFSVAIALLIALSIYCYLIKYRAKQKQLLPFHYTNNELINV